MTRIKALIAGCIGTLACVASAHAADPAGSWRPPPAPDYEAPVPRYKELLSGWYLRGDIGYRLNTVGSIAGPAPVTSQQYEKAVGGTFGFGYKYQWFRVDLTIDRGTPSKISGTTSSVSNQPQYSAKVGSLSAMANVYLDLGVWSGFTPYLGAGVGATQLKSVSLTDTSQPQGFIAADGSTADQPGKALNFSWALMGGVAYQVAPNWMIDIGYRYLSLGNVSSIDGAGTTNNAPVFKNLTAQEARIGVRFLFD